MKDRLNLRLGEEKILTDFREFVKEQHKGKFKEFYRYEVKQAFKYYLAVHNYKDYPAIMEGDAELKYIILPSPLHTHSKRSFRSDHVNFLITFFKYHHGKKSISRTKLIKFIKKALVIKDQRAIDEWIIFLGDIGWIEAHMNNFKIILKDYSLYEILGSDPTGIHNPEGNFITEAENVFNTKAISEDRSRGKIRRN